MTVAPGTGLHPRPFAASTLQTYFPHVQASSHRSLLVVSQSGESIQGLHERAKEFLRRFVAYVDANLPNVKSVLLVSHAATVIALGRALVGHPDMDVRAGTASLSHYTRSLETVRQAEHDSYGHWTCKSNGETGHLAGGEQRNWSFEGEVDYEEHGIADILEESELSGLDIDHAALYRYQSIPGLTKKHKL
ncbi:C6 zinc cluster transcription factor-like protein [Cystobasidiomycetes sp. EMM_F5]